MQPDPLMLIALIGAHLFLDYAGQGDFMARAKNPNTEINGVPWMEIMIAHCAIHGAAVALITGIWWLFFAEFAAHAITDCAKCSGKISFLTDQNIHFVCKLAWFAVAWYVA